MAATEKKTTLDRLVDEKMTRLELYAQKIGEEWWSAIDPINERLRQRKEKGAIRLRLRVRRRAGACTRPEIEWSVIHFIRHQKSGKWLVRPRLLTRGNAFIVASRRLHKYCEGHKELEELATSVEQRMGLIRRRAHELSEARKQMEGALSRWEKTRTDLFDAEVLLEHDQEAEELIEQRQGEHQGTDEPSCDWESEMEETA